jgi:hypothetical protein
MRDVIGHHYRGARKLHRAGRAPDVQSHERSRHNAHPSPRQTIAPVTHPEAKTGSYRP